ncbi:MAG: signal peptidase I [Clostridia bacterium]|nr:signal peptidase I [Clostridia bacterium]MDD4387073.1 signal peptidase I [Clostridia bacterium]
MKKQFKIILNILIWVFIVIAAAITIISLNTKEKGVSNFFGYIPLSIQSASMEPAIYTGDLIISEKSDVKTLKEGDVISFFSIEKEKVVIITHRIKEAKNDKGVLSFVTKGDNNELIDEKEVAPGDIVSKFDGIKISKAGYLLDFFKSKIGFFVCIILPLFLIFIFQLVNFVLIMVRIKQDDNITNS